MKNIMLIFTLIAFVRAGCPNSCSGHGICTPDNTCKCNVLSVHSRTFWTGGDCSIKGCPRGRAWSDIATGVDTAHAKDTECSNRGHCQDGACVCQTGFEGVACERLSCPGTPSCNGHGRCMTMREYAETERNPTECRTVDVNHQNTVKCTAKTVAERPLLPDSQLEPKACGTQCELTYKEETNKGGLKSYSSYSPYKYELPWDADMIQGCKCDIGWHGFDCSLRTCPKGDDPYTYITSNGNIQTDNDYTRQEIKVKQGTGTFSLGFMGAQTSEITATDTPAEMIKKLKALPTIDDVSVTLSPGSNAVSASQDVTFTVTFLQQYATIPRLTYSSGTLELNYVKTHVGEKEDITCSGRGTCATDTGTCTCATFFKSSNGLGKAGVRGDCGFADGSVVSCPAMNMGVGCSGQNGFCSGPPTYQCTCNNPFMGADCFEFQCPSGPAWFDLPYADDKAHQNVECSNRGLCDRTTGLCVCDEAFTGAACERLKCPENGLTCSGKGTCLTMANLAEHGIDSTTGATASYTYGRTPGDSLRWDHASIKGCKCDPGHTGFDCSLKDCPKGDNAYTRLLKVGSLEKQKNHKFKITCPSGATGTITLKYRDQSVAIPTTSTVSAFETLIRGSLTELGDITVGLSEGSTVCASSTNIVTTIELLTLHNGNTNYPDQTLGKPAEGIYSMVVDASSPNGVTVATEAGTKEYNVCSDRGICDTTTGQCTCFQGAGSSDGQGNLGTLANCGYINPFATSSSS